MILTCKECGKSFEYSGMGRPRSFCPLHDGHTTRTVEGLQKRAEQAERAAAGTALVGAQEPNPAGVDADHPSAGELLAVGLGIDKDPERAAKIVGLDVASPEALAVLVADAKRHVGLSERKPAAIGTVIHSTLAIVAIHLRAKASDLRPSTAATTIKSLAQAMEMIQGGTRPAYTALNFVITGPDGETLNMTPQPTNGAADKKD